MQNTTAVVCVGGVKLWILGQHLKLVGTVQVFERKLQLLQSFSSFEHLSKHSTLSEAGKLNMQYIKSSCTRCPFVEAVTGENLLMTHNFTS